MSLASQHYSALMAVFWSAQPNLPAKVGSAFWTAFRKLKERQDDRPPKKCADQIGFRSFRQLYELYRDDHARRINPESDKQPNRRIVVSA